MSTTPLPRNLPTAAEAQERLEVAQLALELLQHTVMTALVTAQGNVERLLANDCPPDELLTALRSVHEAAKAMLLPAEEIFTQLLETQQWAERVSWDALAVPLYDTAPLPAGDDWWLDGTMGGFGAGVN